MRLRSINNLARPRIIVAIALLSVSAFAQSASSEQKSASSEQKDVLIKNAIVMTVTHGNIKNGSVYIKNGKISAVGENVNAPASAAVIDAGGKYVTPGIVDSHSHIALDIDRRIGHALGFDEIEKPNHPRRTT